MLLHPFIHLLSSALLITPLPPRNVCSMQGQCGSLYHVSFQETWRSGHSTVCCQGEWLVYINSDIVAHKCLNLVGEVCITNCHPHSIPLPIVTVTCSEGYLGDQQCWGCPSTFSHRGELSRMDYFCDARDSILCPLVSSSHFLFFSSDSLDSNLDLISWSPLPRIYFPSTIL